MKCDVTDCLCSASDWESWCTWVAMTNVLHCLHIQVEFLLMCRSDSLDIHCRVALHLHKLPHRTPVVGAPAVSGHILRRQRGQSLLQQTDLRGCYKEKKLLVFANTALNVILRLIFNFMSLTVFKRTSGIQVIPLAYFLKNLPA